MSNFSGVLLWSLAVGKATHVQQYPWILYAKFGAVSICKSRATLLNKLTLQHIGTQPREFIYLSPYPGPALWEGPGYTRSLRMTSLQKFLVGAACHRDFDPPGTLVRRTNIPRDFGLGDHLLRIGDNGRYKFLVGFLGVRVKGCILAIWEVLLVEKRMMIYTVLSYGYALNCIAASTVTGYQTGLKAHWRFRSGVK